MDEKRRLLLFALACLPARVAIALVVGLALPKAPRWPSLVAGAILFLVSLSFLSFVLRLRARETGLFKGRAFWAPARPVHAALYLIAAALAFAGGEALRYAGVVLGADVAVGLALVLVHYEVRVDPPPPPPLEA